MSVYEVRSVSPKATCAEVEHTGLERVRALQAGTLVGIIVVLDTQHHLGEIGKQDRRIRRHGQPGTIA